MALILGLDLDPFTVRGVVVRTALRTSQIVNYISIPIAESDSPEAHSDALRDAIRQLLALLPEPPDRVYTELSGDEASLRKLAFPAKVAKRVRELLPHELEGEVPFDPLESVVDYQVAGTADGQVRVLAVVVPKDKIRAHLNQLSALGLSPREVAVGAVALDGLVPLVPALATPGPHCLIDIHPEGTDVCILVDGVAQFARTISVSTRDIDAGHQSRLDRELRQTLAAWRMDGGASPSVFYACGSMAVREGTDAWLSRIVGAPVEVLRLPAVAGGLAEHDRPAFARAAALAGRALVRTSLLNARQGEFAAAQTATALRQNLPLLATCGLAIMAAFIFSSYARYSVLDARHAQLQDELASLTDTYFDTEARSADQALRLLERGARGNDPMPQFDAYDALAAISDAIPEEVTHDVRQLQIDLGDGEETGRFSIRGTVSSESEVDTVTNALRSYRVIRHEGDADIRLVCFHGLDPGNSSATGEGRRSYRLEGEIHCRPEGQVAEADEEEEAGRRRRRGGRGN